MHDYLVCTAEHLEAERRERNRGTEGTEEGERDGWEDFF